MTTGAATSSGGGAARGAPPAGWPAWAAGALLAAAVALAYGGSFSVPMLFDDQPSIQDNASLRHLGTAFWPPAQATVGGRPVLNLTLAANYAVSGMGVWSYHAANLAIHILAAWTLLGIVRRTLARRQVPQAPLLAFCVALLWALHPLQTESVTYLIQRAESLMGLLYLLTLYCFIRGAEAGGPGAERWYAASVGACLLGMGTKEVMVSAPLVVLLYDRAFLAGSFGEALRRRGRVYAGLAATWIALAVLVAAAKGRGGSAGYGVGVTAWSYALTQVPAIARYLRLAVWPSPLIFDYGTALEVPSIRLLPFALFLAGLAAASAWALVRRPALGFLGAAFFAVLAPSSSVVPVATETIAEHRMYLPLVAVVFLAVAAIHRVSRRATLPLSLALAAALGAATWQRNRAYASSEAIWSDTVAKLPTNDRAQYNLGCELAGVPGRLGDAIGRYEAALRLNPLFVSAHTNLGTALASLGRTDEAIAHYREALRLDPGLPEAHNDLGNALSSLGRTAEATAEYEAALRLKPDYVEAHNDLGCALAKTPGRIEDSLAEFRAALRLKPDFYQADYNMANALNTLGRPAEAVEAFERALRVKPDDPTIRFYLSGALLKIPGRADEAVAQLREVLRLDPGNEPARRVLAKIEALRR